MTSSYRIALVSFAVLVGSPAFAPVNAAPVNQGVVISTLAQSDVRSILRDIQRGVPISTIADRYNISSTELSLLQSFATKLDIDDIRELRQELRSLVRDIRSGTSLQQALQERGITLSQQQTQQLLALAERLGVDVSRITDRLDKFEQKAQRKEERRAEKRNETQPKARGASAGAPYGYAYGYRERMNQELPANFTPGRRTGQMTDDQETTGSLTSPGRGGRGNSTGPRGLDRADEVASPNSAFGRETAREASGGSASMGGGMGGGNQAGGAGNSQGGGQGGNSGNQGGGHGGGQGGGQGGGHGGGEGGGKGHK